MKNRIIILSLCASCLLAIVAFVYNSETKTDPLALSPIVAKRVTTPTGTLVSCNLKALKDTVDIPLSYLTEELQVVKLDNRDEALVGGWIRTTVGEKYILVSNNLAGRKIEKCIFHLKSQLSAAVCHHQCLRIILLSAVCCPS